MHSFSPTRKRAVRTDQGRYPDSSVASLMPWLAVERFEYESLERQSSIARLCANIDAKLGAPAGAMLVVQSGQLRSVHPVVECATCDRCAGSGHVELASRLLWRASFELPLDVVEDPGTLFSLTADQRVAIALPSPHAVAADRQDSGRSRGLSRVRIRRHFVSLAAGLAIAAAAGPAVGAAVAGASTHGHVDSAAAAALRSGSTDEHSTTTGPTTTDVSTRRASAGKSASRSTTGSETTAARTTTAPKQTPRPRKPAVTNTSNSADPTTHSQRERHCAPGLLPKDAPERKAAEDCPVPKAAHHRAPERHRRHGHGAAHSKPGKHPAATHRPDPPPSAHKPRPAAHHPGGSHEHSLPNGDAHPKPAPASPVRPVAPVTPVAGAGVPFGTVAPSAPVTTSPWSLGLNPAPFAGGEFSRLSSLLAKGKQPPLFLVEIYKEAARRYHVPWRILAAINSIETNYGRNLSVSSAGAIGWMQFMPATWRSYAVAATRHRRANPYNPRDAIFTAARYLAANGARHHLHRAIFAYNHAAWYVEAVLLKAQTIVDRRTSLRHPKGYALPLAQRYMHELGRTDDGVDIETAPDGALVYSITPGVVSAVASDPGGFGPDYPVIVATKGPLAGKAIYYGHVALNLVSPGQHVGAGQPIAVMGHTGDAAPLAHGHIEIGFSNPGGDPVNQHGAEPATPAGAAMRVTLIELSALYGVRNS